MFKGLKRWLGRSSAAATPVWDDVPAWAEARQFVFRRRAGRDLELAEPRGVIGKSTVDAIRSGVVSSTNPSSPITARRPANDGAAAASFLRVLPLRPSTLTVTLSPSFRPRRLPRTLG